MEKVETMETIEKIEKIDPSIKIFTKISSYYFQNDQN